MSEKELKSKEAKELYQAMSKLENTKECEIFMRDLCTFSEIKSMMERFQVAKRVSNKQTYREITKETGISSATVTRVAHWLHHGMGGYDLILNRM